MSNYKGAKQGVDIVLGYLLMVNLKIYLCQLCFPDWNAQEGHEESAPLPQSLWQDRASRWWRIAAHFLEGRKKKWIHRKEEGEGKREIETETVTPCGHPLSPSRDGHTDFISFHQAAPLRDSTRSQKCYHLSGKRALINKGDFVYHWVPGVSNGCWQLRERLDTKVLA